MRTAARPPGESHQRGDEAKGNGRQASTPEKQWCTKQYATVRRRPRPECPALLVHMQKRPSPGGASASEFWFRVFLPHSLGSLRSSSRFMRATECSMSPNLRGRYHTVGLSRKRGATCSASRRSRGCNSATGDPNGRGFEIWTMWRNKRVHPSRSAC